MSDKVYVQLKDAPPGLDLKISEGKSGPPSFDHSKLAPATRLAEPDVAAMLARAKPITTDPTDQQAFALRPDYMQDVVPNEDEVNFSDHGLALTRRFRALKIWLSVKVLGLGWFRELVDRCCGLARSRQCFCQVEMGGGQ